MLEPFAREYHDPFNEHARSAKGASEVRVLSVRAVVVGSKAVCQTYPKVSTDTIV